MFRACAHRVRVIMWPVSETQGPLLNIQVYTGAPVYDDIVYRYIHTLHRQVEAYVYTKPLALDLQPRTVSPNPKSWDACV